MSTSLHRTRISLFTLGTLSLVVLALLGLLVAHLRTPEDTRIYPQITQPPQTIAVPTVAFIGDSYSSGTGSTGFSSRFTTLVSAYEGWSQQNFAYGGTGYLRSTPTNRRSGCSQRLCPNYQGVIAAVQSSDPNIVVISGGRNDVGLPQRDVDTAIESFYTRLREAVPEARIIVTSPLWAATTPPAQLAAISEDVREQASRIDATYLDLGEPLVDDQSLVSTDNVHPNNAGHAEIARRFEVALSESRATAPVSPTPSSTPTTNGG